MTDPRLDDDRSALESDLDIRRARERLFSALLHWWEKPTREEDEDSMDRGSVAETMRSILRDAEKSILKQTQRSAQRTKRQKVPA